MEHLFQSILDACPAKNAQTLLERIERINSNREKRALKCSGASDGSRYSNSASALRGKETSADLPAKVNSSPSICSIRPQKAWCSAPLREEKVTYIHTPDSFHFFTKSVTSSNDARMFIALVTLFGLEGAAYLAPILRLQHWQPLLALLSALSEPDKSYSKQSVAQEPPSG